MNIKPIINFDGYYISEDGKVYCDLGKGNRDRLKRTDMYEIKGRPTKGGYLRVCIRNIKTNKRVDKYIHRLVAEYFIPNPNGYNVVNHLDCDRTNNHYTNLEWCTHKHNNEYALSLGRNKRDSLGRFVSGLC